MTRQEAEKSLLISLEKVIAGIHRLEEQVREDARFLKRIAANGDVSDAWRHAIDSRLERMEKDWPEIFQTKRED